MKMLLTLVCIYFFLICCTERDIPVIQEIEIPEISPLDVGNQWIFLQRDIDSLGLISDPIDTLTYTVMEKLTTANLYGYYSIEVLSVRFSNSNFIYQKNNSSGLWSLNTYNQPYTSDLFLKFPSAIGDTYQWGGYTVTIFSTDTTIIVPAGSFSCYHYYLSDGDTTSPTETIISNLYYSPENGHIKGNSFRYKNNQRISGTILELDSIHIVK